MENKKLILDYSKWICGGGLNKLGEGSVALLNKEGYMCCLGQWSLQLGATDQAILNNGEPSELGMYLPGLTIMSNEDDEYMTSVCRNSKLSMEAMTINDDEETTTEEKIILLTEACERHGFELEVINRPSTTE